MDAYPSSHCPTRIRSIRLGASIDEPFIIADWKTKGVTMNWLYTAISRATRYSDIYFLHESLYESCVDVMLDDMIKGYKCQDRKAGRDWDEEDYVCDIWIKAKYRMCKTCRICGNSMAYEKGNVCKITVNRLDNSLAHVMENCELLCKLCNCSCK